MRNRNFTFIPLVVVPMLVALAIYFHWELPQGISAWLARYVGDTSTWGAFGVTTRNLVRDYGAVLFLSFSLASLLLLATRIGRSLFTLVLLLALAALFEFGQFTGVIPGLYSRWDFFVEAAAVALAYFFYWTGSVNA